MHDAPRRSSDLSAYRDVKGYNRYRDELIVSRPKVDRPVYGRNIVDRRSPSDVYDDAERQPASPLAEPWNEGERNG